MLKVLFVPPYDSQRSFDAVGMMRNLGIAVVQSYDSLRVPLTPADLDPAHFDAAVCQFDCGNSSFARLMLWVGRFAALGKPVLVYTRGCALDHEMAEALRCAGAGIYTCTYSLERGLARVALTKPDLKERLDLQPAHRQLALNALQAVAADHLQSLGLWGYVKGQLAAQAARTVKGQLAAQAAQAAQAVVVAQAVVAQAPPAGAEGGPQLVRSWSDLANVTLFRECKRTPNCSVFRLDYPGRSPSLVAIHRGDRPYVTVSGLDGGCLAMTAVDATFWQAVNFLVERVLAENPSPAPAVPPDTSPALAPAQAPAPAPAQASGADLVLGKKGKVVVMSPAHWNGWETVRPLVGENGKGGEGGVAPQQSAEPQPSGNAVCAQSSFRYDQLFVCQQCRQTYHYGLAHKLSALPLSFCTNQCHRGFVTSGNGNPLSAEIPLVGVNVGGPCRRRDDDEQCRGESDGTGKSAELGVPAAASVPASDIFGRNGGAAEDSQEVEPVLQAEKGVRQLFYDRVIRDVALAHLSAYRIVEELKYSRLYEAMGFSFRRGAHDGKCTCEVLFPGNELWQVFDSEEAASAAVVKEFSRVCLSGWTPDGCDV